MAPKDKRARDPEGPKKTIPTPSAPPMPVTIAPRAPAAPSGGNSGDKGGRGGSGGRGGGSARPPVFTFNPRPPGSPPIKVPPDGPPNIPGIDMGPRPPVGGPVITLPLPPVPGREEETTPDTGGGYDPYAAYQQMQQDIAVNNVIAVVTALFKEYGLESLTSKIIEYAKQGYGGDAIGVMLRDTPEYKARFPAMATLMSRKRTISEAEYIAYEKQAAALEKRYGLPTGLVSNSVTRLLENEVSASELQDRVVLASDAALQSPPELRDTFRNYYGIDTGGLAGYFLDPAQATPILQRQFVASQIGAEAMRQSVGIRVDVAENLQQLGVTQDVAREGFANVSRQMAYTTGKGDIASQEQLIGGNLLQREQDIREIERVAAARTGRFQSGGSYIQESAGVSGLGSART